MSSLNSYVQDLKNRWSGKILLNCPMAGFSTLKVGGPADAIMIADSLSELTELMVWLHDRNLPWQVVGRGSNILIPDEGLAGVTLILGKDFSAVEIISSEKTEIKVRAGAACSLAKLLAYCTKHQFSGLEFAVGIPGSVGGAIVMNAGCWGREIADVLSDVTILNPAGKVQTKFRENLDFSYRKWKEYSEGIVVSGTFSLAAGEEYQIKAACNDYNRLRKKQQPQKIPSAGSFFKNPPEHAAGKLIEDAGLKGLKVGGAMVSSKHANFIVNTGSATATDVFNLMRQIQSTVYDKSGIMLEPEVHILRNKESK